MDLCISNFIKTFAEKSLRKEYFLSLKSGTLDFFHRSHASQNPNLYHVLKFQRNHNKNVFYFASRLSSSIKSSKNVQETRTDTLGSIPDFVLGKVKYNCILSEKETLNWRQKSRLKRIASKEEKIRRHNVIDSSFCLNYLNDNPKSEVKQEETHSTVYPFSRSIINKASDLYDDQSSKFYSNREIDVNPYYAKVVREAKNWMENYEVYSGENDVSDHFRSDSKWQLNYGTPDKSIPISNIPCGGCGAHLHCKDTGLPGYLPSELFRNCSSAELKAFKCQRCHFLEQYNIALNLTVSPEEYTSLLSQIKNEVALALVLVDLADFPCSLWPNIIDIIGTKRPVIVAGNKIDLLPRDSPNFLLYVKQWFENMLKKSPLAAANIKDTALISARTGFGIESLITKLHNVWQYKGDVYLLGCTNVGKSTLFNTLLQSDYCKVQASDIVLRATTSLWPGTTLNLLKFPILRADGYRLYQRTLRLQELQRQEHLEEQLLRKTLRKQRDPRRATFIGHIGTTMYNADAVTEAEDPFSVTQSESGGRVQFVGLNPQAKEFHKSKWFFDTPGTIHPDQILDILTAQELVYLLPRKMVLPRTFQLFAGDTLLIAGLGRLDFEGEAPKCRFTVFAADSLPITICRTIDVELVYKYLAASNVLKVPSFEPERLSLWPGLSPAPSTINITGLKEWESAADIVLSSAGWISVTPKEREVCVLKAWTPFAKGIHVRQPPLMRFSVKLRGKTVRKTPAYLLGKAVDL